MNTIYDNTFVLGQTSATNFIAGQGIKIDEPSAGTVRIGTDETVLYSGTLTSGTTASLSENITNFERIAFEGYGHNGINYTCRCEAPVLNVEMHLMGLTYWPGEQDFVTCDITANNKVSTRGTYVEAGSKVNKFNATITKVIGINRISGGNE